MTTAMGETNLTPGSAVGRLGQDAAAAEAALAASRDTAADAGKASDKAPDNAADAAAGGDKAPDKTGEDAAKAEAITAAEKAVAEAKTPEEKAAAEAKLAELKGEKPAAKSGAPEKYEEFKLPDGQKLDEAALTEALPVFKELNLSQEQAQKLVDLQAKFVQKSADAALENWNKHMETVLADAKADKEIGGQGWDQNLGLAKKAITAFGTPALQEYLNTAEAGSHKEIIRFFAKVGKAVSEDGFVPGAAAAAKPKDAASLIYTNSNHN